MIDKSKYFLPTLGQSWMIFLIIAGIGSMLGWTVQTMFTMLPAEPQFVADFMTKVFSYVLLFVPFFFYLLYQSRTNYERAMKTHDGFIKIDQPYFGSINPILFFILITLSLFALNVVIDPISDLMKMPQWFKDAMGSMMGGNIWCTIMAVCILAPLCEEFVCRGIILRGLAYNLNPTKAILWSSLIFAVLHMNPWQAIPAFILGMFIGWVYYKTHSIWSAIFLHCLNNSFSTFISYKYPDMPIDASIKSVINNPSVYWLIFSISIGILALTFFFLNKYIPKLRYEKALPIFL